MITEVEPKRNILIVWTEWQIFTKVVNAAGSETVQRNKENIVWHKSGCQKKTSFSDTEIEVFVRLKLKNTHCLMRLVQKQKIILRLQNYNIHKRGLDEIANIIYFWSHQRHTCLLIPATKSRLPETPQWLQSTCTVLTEMALFHRVDLSNAGPVQHTDSALVNLNLRIC